MSHHLSDSVEEPALRLMEVHIHWTLGEEIHHSISRRIVSRRQILPTSPKTQHPKISQNTKIRSLQNSALKTTSILDIFRLHLISVEARKSLQEARFRLHRQRIVSRQTFWRIRILQRMLMWDHAARHTTTQTLAKGRDLSVQ